MVRTAYKLGSVTNSLTDNQYLSF